MTTLPSWLRGAPGDWYLSTLTEFYGPSTATRQIDAPAGMPSALRETHRALGPTREAVYQQNVLVPPRKLRAIDGRLVFYVENQGVTRWACDVAESEPAVWVEDFESRASVRAWLPESERLRGFLFQTLLFEIAIGSPFGAVEIEIPTSAIGILAGEMTPAPVGPWRWPVAGGRFYVDEDAVAVVWPGGPAVRPHGPHLRGSAR
jgi:hypothetical protein